MPTSVDLDTSQRVVQAAKRLFFARGYSSTSLRAIARDAGTSESSVLRIYYSKNGLLRAVYAECWAEVNAHVDSAISAAAARDVSPSNLLIELVRSVLELYQSDPAMMEFLLTHFGFDESLGGLNICEDIDPSIDSRVRREYHSYLERIQVLCEEFLQTRPDLRQMGVTTRALGHVFTSIIFGIQASWHMASLEPELTTPSTAPVDEILIIARALVAPETLPKQKS